FHSADEHFLVHALVQLDDSPHVRLVWKAERGRSLLYSKLHDARANSGLVQPNHRHPVKDVLERSGRPECGRHRHNHLASTLGMSSPDTTWTSSAVCTTPHLHAIGTPNFVDTGVNSPQPWQGIGMKLEWTVFILVFL